MFAPLFPHAERLAHTPLSTLAEARSGAAPLTAAGWTLDTCRQRLDAAADAALLDLAREAGLSEALTALFSGAVVNPSEDRPALHWALRAPTTLSGEAEAVRQSLDAPLRAAADLRTGRLTASDGGPFDAIVHIGIGGSDFGPRLLADAFEAERADGPVLRFCANLDPVDLTLALQGLDPRRTLVVGVSKSFGTEETLYNLARARDWLAGALGDRAAAHLALVTARPDKAEGWLGAGGEAALRFHLPLSVGGRFSIWSSAAFSCMAALGPERFRSLLAGAAEMDENVRTAAPGENLAVRLALLDVWNASVLGYPMRVLLAYARRLRLLPAYLQQLEMESNGKSVASPDGTPLSHATAPALWGGEGSIGQHSYHQWLHQGTHPVPSEFILALEPGGDIDGQRALAAHALAQAEVLANGHDLDAVTADAPDLPATVARQKVHAGGRPSTMLVCAQFDAAALGALIALYEHRTYLAGRLWGVNPFDQWGVERGKTMAATLKPVLSGRQSAHDPVTARLADLLGRLG